MFRIVERGWRKLQALTSEDEIRRPTIVLVAVILLLVVATFQYRGQLEPGLFSVFVGLVSVLLVVEIAQSRISELDDEVEELSRSVTDIRAGIDPEFEVLASKSEADDRITSRLRDTSAENLSLIEYSSANASTIVETAVEEGFTIDLLVRNPNPRLKWRTSPNQRERIVAAMRDLQQICYDARREGHDDFELNVRTYNQQASVRGRRVHREYLCLGWYSFDNRTAKNPRFRHVQGHNNPMLGVPISPDEYHPLDELDEMYLTSFYHLWYEGESLWELYSGEHCPDGLFEWFESEPERIEWLRSVSGKRADETVGIDAVEPRTDEVHVSEHLHWSSYQFPEDEVPVRS